MQNYRLFHSIQDLHERVGIVMEKPGMFELLSRNQHVFLPYYHHSEAKFRLKPFIPESVSFEEYWTLLRYSRFMKASHVNPFGTEHSMDQFSYLETEQMKQQIHEISVNGVGKLVHEKKMLDQTIFVRLKGMRTEAIHSAILEGAHTTPEKGDELLLGDENPLDESEQMVVNNYKAMKFVKDNIDVDLSKELLLELHRIVLEGIADKEGWAGSFRKKGEEVRVINDSTNEVLHNGVSSELLESYLDNMIAWVNDAEHFFHPLLKGIVMHFLYGYLHPHMDGNGRMARLLFYWFVLKSDFWIFEYLPISSIILHSRAGYRDSFLKVESDLNDLTYFIEDQLRVIHESYTSYRAELDAREQFMKDFRILIASLNSRQATVVQTVLEERSKTFTVQQHAKSHDISMTVARDDLHDLVRRGILETQKLGKKFLYNVKSDTFRSDTIR